MPDAFFNGKYVLTEIEGFFKPVTLVMTEFGLKKVLFEKAIDVSMNYEASGYTVLDASSISAGQQFIEYFEGKRKGFDLTLDIGGTPFQQKVWDALIKIPYGKTLTYKQVAELAGSPLASRAAGSACKTNPLPIIIPCHRVVPKAGGLGNYTGGVGIKEALLNLESSL